MDKMANNFKASASSSVAKYNSSGYIDIRHWKNYDVNVPFVVLLITVEDAPKLKPLAVLL